MLVFWLELNTVTFFGMAEFSMMSNSVLRRQADRTAQSSNDSRILPHILISFFKQSQQQNTLLSIFSYLCILYRIISKLILSSKNSACAIKFDKILYTLHMFQYHLFTALRTGRTNNNFSSHSIQKQTSNSNLS